MCLYFNLGSYLILESLEVVEDRVAEAVVEGLRHQGGGQVPGAHPGEGAAERRGVVGGHRAEVVVEGRPPLGRRLQPVDLQKKNVSCQL